MTLNEYVELRIQELQEFKADWRRNQRERDKGVWRNGVGPGSGG